MEKKKSTLANLENKRVIFFEIGLIFTLATILLAFEWRTGYSQVAGIPIDPYEIPEGDKTLSPYFYIHSDDPENERLPLKSTSADVHIAGVIADVVVTQVYKNEGKKPIEAIYVFPASTRAAVYSMVMTIGERVILAKIEQKDRARQQYEEAKNAGQSASLLEQERPNVFTMNVANIMPGDVIEVELKYTEILVPEDKIYRFVYPTVVGPRYSSGSGDIASSDAGWNANPYTYEGVGPLYEFNIKADVSAGMAIKDLRCPSHQAIISYSGKSKASVSLADDDRSGGNRDFILEYRLAGQQVEAGVLLFKGEKENFFLAMIQPPDRIAPEMIPPREYVFIVDVSGSMHGYPLETSKKLLRDLIGGLRPTDRFNVLLFAGGSSVFSETSVNANQEHIRAAINFIDRENGGGGTELLPALKRALSLRGPEGVSRTFIIATDGYVTVEKEAFDLVRTSLGSANFFAFGIGSGVNRFLIEGLAHAGQGEPFVITGPEEAPAVADKFRKYIASPVLTDIQVAFNGLDVYDLAQESYPDIFAERPVMIFGKYRGTPAGSIVVTGNGGSGIIQRRVDLAMAGNDSDNSALRYLWAREKIRQLSDFAGPGYGMEEAEAEVTRLGLEYNLLTNYTSFIAIDSEVRNQGGNGTSVRQPLPLPQGVSNYAVGGATMSKSMNMRTGAPADACNALMQEVAVVEDEEQTFSVVESMPEFPGGEKALEKFLADHLRYPEAARVNGIRGVVFVTFVVEENGKISEIRILRGIGGGCDEEALRVVKLMPDWIPGKQGGKAVKVQYTLPIRFSIEN